MQRHRAATAHATDDSGEVIALSGVEAIMYCGNIAANSAGKIIQSKNQMHAPTTTAENRRTPASKKDNQRRQDRSPTTLEVVKFRCHV